jgi:aspartate aminotransferase
MTKISSRMGQFRPSPTASTSELVRRLRAEGQDIIGLVGGEPDFPTPDTIKQAGIRAIETNNTRYTDVDGTPELRKALSEKFKRENGLDYAPDQIVVTNGTKPLLHAALMAMTDPGDEVIIPAPHWVSHPDITRIVGAVPVSVPCPPETGFRLAPEALEAAITPMTRVLILNSPNNPTGTAYSADDLRGIIAVLKRHPGIWVLTDEIYEHIRFDDVAVPSIAALDPEIAERTVTANGFSKGYVMTGWRVGFAGGPRPMMKAIKLLIGQLVGAPGAIGQAAAVEALTGPQDFIQKNAAIFQERRDIALQILQQSPGLRCHVPEGAFYLFADCTGVLGRTMPNGKTIETDTDFVHGMIEQGGVAVVPGSAFGLSPFFRMTYSLETAQLRTAMERIRRFCNELR